MRARCDVVSKAKFIQGTRGSVNVLVETRNTGLLLVIECGSGGRMGGGREPTMSMSLQATGVYFELVTI